MSDISIASLQNDNNLKSVFYHDKCDKYDYLIAAGCGAIAGIVDIFLVGAPLDSPLGNWTDAQVDKVVKKFAKTCGWNPKEGKEKEIASAIGFLERKFQINYDQRHSKEVRGFSMSAKNHHMKSLGHSPDIIGLFFSILNQFTSTSSFLDNGRVIAIATDKYELQGSNFISKLFCGVANWFGHIMSDIAGSSGTRGKKSDTTDKKRGSGVVIPFYELFQLCDFGEFQVSKHRNTLATVATKVFEEGYDARFGLTMAIPVLLCDLSIKLMWALKHYFYHKRPLKECIPTKKHDDLRIMLLIGNGTLCIMDGADALIRSGGNWINFFLRLNIIAWFRFLQLVFRETFIRLGISFPLQRQLDAYIRINKELSLYISKFEKIDIERFKEETKQYNNMIVLLEKSDSEESLNIALYSEYKALGIELPYDGDFDDFMTDRSTSLVFK